MQQDVFKSWRSIPGGIAIRGSHAEMTVTFDDLAAIADAISKETAAQEQRLAPHAKPMLPSLKYGSTQAE